MRKTDLWFITHQSKQLNEQQSSSDFAETSNTHRFLLQFFFIFCFRGTFIRVWPCDFVDVSIINLLFCRQILVPALCAAWSLFLFLFFVMMSSIKTCVLCVFIIFEFCQTLCHYNNKKPHTHRKYSQPPHT